MISNDYGLTTVWWCDKCGYATNNPEKINCPNCVGPMEQIGFVEDRAWTKGIGGSTKQGTCGCGQPNAIKGVDEKGRTRYRTNCQKCRSIGHKYRKDSCDACGFKRTKPGQLDIDHIDGNRSNNDPNNLQTLCKECHKTKTNTHQDWKKKHAN